MNNQQTEQDRAGRDRYVAKVNALVTADREDLIADVTAEYARLYGERLTTREHASP